MKLEPGTTDLAKVEPRKIRQAKPPNFEPDNFATQQVWYPSKDGTKIPMFIVHRKVSVYAGGVGIGHSSYSALVWRSVSSTSRSSLVYLDSFWVEVRLKLFFYLGYFHPSGSILLKIAGNL